MISLGFEPRTPALSEQCSTRLSYEIIKRGKEYRFIKLSPTTYKPIITIISYTEQP